MKNVSTISAWMEEAFGVRISRPPSPAAKRAVARLAARREETSAIPNTGRYTRQRRRAEHREMRKQLRSLRKAYAMEHRERGGAAAVR